MSIFKIEKYFIFFQNMLSKIITLFKKTIHTLNTNFKYYTN